MKGKRFDDLIDLFVNEVKNLPEIEREVNSLLEKIDKPFRMSDSWKDNYQRISEIELNAKNILEKLMPLTEVPVGIGDSFILLRMRCERAKEDLMERKAVDEKILREIEIDRENFVARVRNFVKDLEARERRNLRRILTVLDENRQLRKKILELRAENERLRKLIKE
ncbi:MAG: hypothetical protein DRO89_04935 [Candidatus Altiarchaeales archaeon]|nr:MAG: hypothetical protein DRO89_04935 [Candidatus Altiarchaeales archaeon]